MGIRRTRISARTSPATEPKPTEPRNRSSGGDYTTTTKCIARCTASENAAGKRDCGRERERGRSEAWRGEARRDGARDTQRGESLAWSKGMDAERHEGQHRARGRGEHDAGRRGGAERSDAHSAPVVSGCGGREHLQCTQHAHAYTHTHTHTRGEFTNFGRSLVVSTLSLTLPPAVGSLFPKRHPAGRVVSLSRPSPSSNSPRFSRLCVFIPHLWYIRTYVYTSLSRDERNARTTLTHTRESFVRRAP